MAIQDSIKKLLGFVEGAKGIELKLDEVDAAIKEAKNAGYNEGFLFSDQRNVETIRKINEQIESLKGQMKDPVNVGAIEKKAFQAGVASVVLPDIQAELAAAKLEAEKLGFQKGVASVEIPEQVNTKALEEAAFAAGVASVVIPVDRSAEVEALKLQLEEIQAQLAAALKLNIDLALSQELKLQAALEEEKSKFELAFAEIKNRLAEEQAGKGAAEQIARDFEAQLAESLAKLKESEAKIDGLLAQIDAINLQAAELKSLSDAKDLAIAKEKELAAALQQTIAGQKNDLLAKDQQNEEIELLLIAKDSDLKLSEEKIAELEVKILELSAPKVEEPIPVPVEDPVVEPAPIPEPVIEPAPIVEPIAEPIVEPAPVEEPIVEAPIVEPIVVEEKPIEEPATEVGPVIPEEVKVDEEKPLA